VQNDRFISNRRGLSKENTYNFCVEFYQCGKDSNVFKAVESLKVGVVVDIESKASCSGITEPIYKQQVWNGNHGIAQNSVSYDSGCVRPALWINLESDIF